MNLVENSVEVNPGLDQWINRVGLQEDISRQEQQQRLAGLTIFGIFQVDACR
jgi:hypothetical protein